MTRLKKIEPPSDGDPATENGLTKIRFDLTMATNRADLPDEIGGETLWAESLGDDRYRLRNAPTYALGYADGDIVECEYDQATGWKDVRRMAQDGGNGNVRVYFVDAHSVAAKQVIDELKSVGCNYEVASQHLVCFVVPPALSVPFTQLANYLNATSNNVVEAWEVAKAPRGATSLH